MYFFSGFITIVDCLSSVPALLLLVKLCRCVDCHLVQLEKLIPGSPYDWQGFLLLL